MSEHTPRTMSAEQEAAAWFDVGNRCGAGGSRLLCELTAERAAHAETRAKLAEAERDRDEARESVRYALNEGVPKLVATVKDGLDAIRATAEAKFAEYGRALAAAQAHAKALREALESHITDTGYCVQCDSANYHHEPDCLTGSALALPADTSALDAERAKERERVDELIAATEALIETAESHAMQSYDRGGVTGRKIDAARAAIRALEPRSGDGTNVPGPAPAEGGRETR